MKRGPAGSRAARVPVATYRLQLDERFGFGDAEEIVDYLSRLGVSDCYVSPILRARRHSRHCYDVVDHAELNPELGRMDSLEALVGSLRVRRMGLVVDIVPNHMAASSENRLWRSVLEYGRSSPWAGFFDIDWFPAARDLRDKVLLPVLGSELSEALAAICIQLDADCGSLSLRLEGGESVPLAPSTYPLVLGSLAGRRGSPGRKGGYTHGEALKKRLAGLWLDRRLRAQAASSVVAFNSEVGGSKRAERFGALLRAQRYVLAYWREASSRINYRRFLLVNDLVALRADRREVFDESHALLLELASKGWITGLRVDHCDGLSDPGQYFGRLASAFARKSGRRPYLVAEKVLEGQESLPETWDVSGTTGYDFARDATSLFVRRESSRAISGFYRQFTKRRRKIGEEAVLCKRLAASGMGSELDSISRLLKSVSEAQGGHVDLREARRAIVETIAHLRVYRVYPRGGRLTSGDTARVLQAVRRAGRVPEGATDAVEAALLGTGSDGGTERLRATFVERFSQAAVKATVTGVEDTAFYRYNRLVCLNEVGGDPGRFGISVDEFHRRVAARALSWPHAMLASTTHDTKRSEDVRARIGVVSELPREWASAVALWSELNAPLKARVGGKGAPSANDEYLFYQTIVGAWPLSPLGGAARQVFVDRMVSYMTKAAREAKERTSWIDQNPGYEEALARFVKRALDPERSRGFLEAFKAFEESVAFPGMLSSLSQLLLKLTCPGVPDIYQGTEVWNFSLVDPDNRRPVDFRSLSAALGRLESEVAEAGSGRSELTSSLLASWRDGSVKMYVIASALAFRARHRALFDDGLYRPLRSPSGVCAFARELDGERCVVAVPTSFARFVEPWKNNGRAWGSARFSLGDGSQTYRDEFTGRRVSEVGGGARVGDLFRDFPLALLVRE